MRVTVMQVFSSHSITFTVSKEDTKHIPKKYSMISVDHRRRKVYLNRATFPINSSDHKEKYKKITLYY